MGSNITSTPTATIQKSLGVAADNNYGQQTTAAVKAFQTANGLTADGVFGPQTLAAYNTKYSPDAASNLITTSAPAQSTFLKNSTALTSILGAYGASQYGPNGGAYGAPVTDATGKTVGAAQFDPNTGKPLTPPTSTTPTPPTSDPTLGTTADPFIRQLDTMSATSNASTKLLINNIKASEFTQANSLTKQSEDYQKGLQLLGIQSGSAEGTPDLLMGHVQQAKIDLQDKIKGLVSEETKAISDAETAKENQDFQLLDKKMTYLKQIQTDKAQALKDYYTNVTASNTQAASTAKTVAADVYSSLGTLDDADKQAFINAIALKFNIPAGTLVSALAAYQTTQNKNNVADLLSPTEAASLGVPYGTTKTQAATKGIVPKKGTSTTTDPTKAKPYKFTNTSVGQLANTGLTPDDITKLQEDIAAHGVQDVISNPKSGLTQEQKDLITKIVSPKKTAAGGRTS